MLAQAITFAAHGVDRTASAHVLKLMLQTRHQGLEPVWIKLAAFQGQCRQLCLRHYLRMMAHQMFQDSVFVMAQIQRFCTERGLLAIEMEHQGTGDPSGRDKTTGAAQ